MTDDLYQRRAFERARREYAAIPKEPDEVTSRRREQLAQGLGMAGYVDRCPTCMQPVKR